MNYKDWLAKYYPIPANEIKGTDIELINHAILKWEGLLDLNDYNLRFSGTAVLDKETNKSILIINGESCSLCEKYYRRDDTYDNICEDCPLSKILGHPCDSGNHNNEALYWQALKNPQLMIDALIEAREMVERENFTISQIDNSDD